MLPVARPLARWVVQVHGRAFLLLLAALVCQRRQHVVELFAWPDGGHLDRGPAERSRGGCDFLRWNRDGMAFWAVSDLNAQEPADFTLLWQAGRRGGLSRRRFYPAALRVGAATLAMTSPNGPALRAGPRSLPVVARSGSSGNTSSAKR